MAATDILALVVAISLSRAPEHWVALHGTHLNSEPMAAWHRPNVSPRVVFWKQLQKIKN